MVLGAIAASVGMGALGGALGGIGASQAGRADRRALRQRRDAVQNRNSDTQALSQALQSGYRGLSGQRNDLLSDQIGAFGRQGLATDASRQQAAQALQGAQNPFQRAGVSQFTQQAPAGFAAQTRERVAQRYAPQQALQESALARALAGADQRQEASDLYGRGLGIDRTANELSMQQALQQALVDRQYGVESTAADRAAINAQGTGQFMGALGGLVNSLAPAVGYSLAGRPATPLEPQPNYGTLAQAQFATGMHPSQLNPGLGLAPPVPYRGF